MLEIAGSLYLLATAAFALMAGIVGVRLVLLSRQTGQAPERMLGSGIVCTATLGYGLMILGLLAGQRAAAAGRSTAVFTVLAFAGWIFHNLGVIQMLRFVVRVFRPGSAPARVVAWVMVAVLWGGWVVYAVQGGVVTGIPNVGYWVAFSVIGTYPIWTATESLLCHQRMRRQLRVGLGDALVCNRFLLWTVASLCSTASIWIVNVPSFLGLDATSEAGRSLSTVTMSLTALCGIATVSLFWLTFLPPVWYRERLQRGAAA